MYFKRKIEINDKRTAYIAAMTEIRQYNIKPREANVKLPVDELPEHVFFCFFENPDTGEAYMRTYLYAKKLIGFVKILNYAELVKQNPVLIDNYIQNGIFFYRNCELYVDVKKQDVITDNTRNITQISYVLKGNLE